MKNKKFAIFAAVVVAVVGFAIYDYQSSQNQEKKKQEQSLLYKKDPDQIQSFVIQTKEQSIELKKEKEGWKLVKPIQELADQKAAEDFVEGLTTEKSVETAIEGEAIDYSAFGLDQPAGSVTVADNLGETTVFTVGNRKNYQGDAFLRKNQENRVLIASSTWFPKFEKKALDFRDKRLMKDSSAAIQKLTFHREKESFQFIKKEDQWVLANHPNWKLDQNKVRELLLNLNQTEALEFIAEGNAKPAELQAWGLAAPRLKIEADLKDGKTWKASFAVGKDKVHRVFLIETNQVLKLSPTDSDKFYQMTADSFRDRSEPFNFDKTKVKEIQIHVGKNVQTLKSESEMGQKVLKQLRDLTVADFQENPKASLTNEILLKGDKEDVFRLQWGSLQKVKINGSESQVVPAKTSSYAKTFTLMESDIASMVKVENQQEKKNP